MCVPALPGDFCSFWPWKVGAGGVLKLRDSRRPRRCQPAKRRGATEVRSQPHAGDPRRPRRAIALHTWLHTTPYHPVHLRALLGRAPRAPSARSAACPLTMNLHIRVQSPVPVRVVRKESKSRAPRARPRARRRRPRSGCGWCPDGGCVVSPITFRRRTQRIGSAVPTPEGPSQIK